MYHELATRQVVATGADKYGVSAAVSMAGANAIAFSMTVLYLDNIEELSMTPETSVDGQNWTSEASAKIEFTPGNSPSKSGSLTGITAPWVRFVYIAAAASGAGWAVIGADVNTANVPA